MGNVACFVPGCREPVIGQCPGYQEPCGRFYCAQHSANKLCIDHAEQSINDLRIQQLHAEYIMLTKDIDKIITADARRIGGAFTICGLLCGLIIGAIAGANSELVILAGMGAFVGFAVGGCVFLLRQSMVRNRVATTITATHPHFDEFYKEYRRQINRNTMAILGYFVAEGLVYKSESAHYHRAVDEELKRRGR